MFIRFCSRKFRKLLLLEGKTLSISCKESHHLLPFCQFNSMYPINHKLFPSSNCSLLKLCYNRPFVNNYIYRKYMRSSCLFCDKKSNETMQSNQNLQEDNQNLNINSLKISQHLMSN